MDVKVTDHKHSSEWCKKAEKISHKALIDMSKRLEEKEKEKKEHSEKASPPPLKNSDSSSLANIIENSKHEVIDVVSSLFPPLPGRSQK